MDLPFHAQGAARGGGKPPRLGRLLSPALQLRLRRRGFYMVMSGGRANVGAMRRFLFLPLSLITVAAAGLSACTSSDPEVIVVTSTVQPQPRAAESSAAAAASTANGTASAENTKPTDDYEASKAESDRLRPRQRRRALRGCTQARLRVASARTSIAFALAWVTAPSRTKAPLCAA